MSTDSAVIFPVILAGGASSRLWPASNHVRPKWDLRLFGQEQSLLQSAWERARSVAPAERCIVVAGQAQAELIRQSLPELTSDNLLIEPEPRDTAGAIAFATGVIAGLPHRGDDAVMLVLPGDHVIRNVERFAQTARMGARAAMQLDALVTFGILPRCAATAYGYIHRGEPVAGFADPAAFRVRQFREKPDAATAQQYVASGEYYWNGGIFLWKLSTLRKEFARQLPAHAELIRCVADANLASAQDAFLKLNKISIDFGILEHAENVATVVADFDWDDIGSWSAVRAHLPKVDGNAVEAATRVLPLDAEGNLVFAPGKRVTLIGVKDVAVVEYGDEILICRLDRDQDVKTISARASK